MRILICDASGFIGQELTRGLRALGHEVVRGVCRPTAPGDIKIDYSLDTEPATWKPLRMHWLIASIGLYGLAGACWLPVVVHQIKMARIAEAACREGAPLPAIYWKLARRWELLGYPAFLAMIAIYFLMVSKPS